MHGGFNEDPKTGIVYTGIPGYGLCSISPDLKTWTRLGTDERLRGNIHGIVVFEHKGQTNIAVAQNEDQRVLIIGLDGEVKQQLSAPVGGEFDFGEANVYYSERPIKQCPWGQPHLPKFACTDVTYLDGKLYVVTGYCDGDFVLTANEEGGQWRWGHTAWGGKGSAAGKFRTAHGVFAYDGHIFVANREAHQVPIPPGANPSRCQSLQVPIPPGANPHSANLHSANLHSANPTRCSNLRLMGVSCVLCR